MIRALLFILLTVILFKPNAQELNLLSSFPLDNPLSYQFIRAIEQDHHGFMWFGSQEGLHRFDGHQFVSYHHDVNQPASLGSDVISRLMVDNANNLWVATRGGGLNLFREATNDFQHFTTVSPNAKLAHDNVNAILQDSLGKIWVGTEVGLTILHTSKQQWHSQQIQQQLGNPNSLTNNMVHALLETQDGHIWVGTNGGGISVFDLAGNFVKQIRFNQQKSVFQASKFINSLYQDHQGYVWIGSVENGLIKYHPKTHHTVHYRYDSQDKQSVASNTIENIYQDSANKIWIATDKGLLIYNAKDDNFWRFHHSVSNPFSLKSDFVLTFFEDSNQMIWIGTFAGVDRWNPYMTTFNQYSAQTHPNLKSNNISGFAQSDENIVFFSTYGGGLYQLELSSNEITPLAVQQDFKDLRITKLYAQGSSLWVGTRASGLYKINLLNNSVARFNHHSADPSSISANSITDIISDRNGTLWVSTYHNGLNRLNSDGRFTRFTSQSPVDESGPSINHILQIIEDEQGIIWLAAYGGGLNRFDPNTERFTHIKHNAKDSKSISSDLAWILYLDSKDNLWVGTQSAGLNILPKAQRLNNQFEFKHLDAKDGMKSRTAYGIREDSEGNIWFSSNKGISRYSSINQRFKHFDTSHGLRDLEYNHGVVFKSDDNTLFFGSAKGFVSINPDSVNKPRQAPLVRLTNIFNLNEPMHFPQPLTKLTELVFDYKDQIISFEYVGLNYAAPESTRYKYRLLGSQEQWIDAGKQRRATYTNLPEGNYTLQVIAGNSDDIWSEPYELKIVMTPPPWKTWWAYMLYASVIALVLLSYSRMLNRKLMNEQTQKEDLRRQVAAKTEDYLAKNLELEQANKKLEFAATTDKVTGVRSRRYLDIYIEQASQLMNQIHQNLLPVQRNILPRLYIVMVQINEMSAVNNSQLINFTDLLLYSRNNDDLVIRWAEDTFAIIGYEKDNNVAELSARLTNRFSEALANSNGVSIAYSFYPFDREQPVELSWDQISVIIEKALALVKQQPDITWLGFYQPKEQPFNYLDILQMDSLDSLKQKIVIKQG
ncbi:two-component regulator propeller domain-containing protein [Thalassotalea sp. G2M2-11]|uniref:ligand-binding sensor domain-containing protein n=1 Tax=Thalassotalea sp. G2M2-11 TaxID=2787627 RepID=UPI003217E1A3